MDGWLALTIAILCKVPTETVFSMLDKGKPKEKRKWTEEDIQYIKDLQQLGLTTNKKPLTSGTHENR